MEQIKKSAFFFGILSPPQVNLQLTVAAELYWCAKYSSGLKRLFPNIFEKIVRAHVYFESKKENPSIKMEGPKTSMAFCHIWNLTVLVLLPFIITI